VNSLQSKEQQAVEQFFVSARIVTAGLRLREGHPKRSRTCDFLEVIRFLTLFRREARNVYQIYHSGRRFDHKKLYRYLRYCLHIGLIELDHVKEGGFLPAKYYRLTEKGRTFLELFKDLTKTIEMGG